MMNKQLFLVTLVFTVAGCNPVVNRSEETPQSKSDQVYQYSIFTALANKIYDGSITVSYVKEKGDLGLGTFNELNGEMIVLDGIVYQLLSDGTLLEPAETEKVPFTVVTFFENDFSVDINQPVDYEQLKGIILEQLPTVNMAFAFKIEGTFDHMVCGGATRQEKPYSKTLSEALADRPVYEAVDTKGTMVGFWIPEYTGKTNVIGFHLHFISTDKKTAGHVIDFQASGLRVDMDKCSGFNIELPDTDEFLKTEFDLNQGYNNPAK